MWIYSFPGRLCCCQIKASMKVTILMYNKSCDIVFVSISLWICIKYFYYLSLHVKENEPQTINNSGFERYFYGLLYQHYTLAMSDIVRVRLQVIRSIWSCHIHLCLFGTLEQPLYESIYRLTQKHMLQKYNEENN